jgi:hypothetical protein
VNYQRYYRKLIAFQFIFYLGFAELRLFMTTTMRKRHATNKQKRNGTKTKEHLREVWIISIIIEKHCISSEITMFSNDFGLRRGAYIGRVYFFALLGAPAC